MKTRFSMLLILLPLTIFASEVKNGDSIDTVRIALGEPRGRAQAGSRELLCYDRGEIELTSGVVTRVALRSAEAQAAFETNYAANVLRVREERARLIAAGETLKASTLADAAFQATPLRYQIAFWENFSRQYAAVSCKEQLSIVRMRLAEQEETSRAKALEAQRLAELEARAAEADREDRSRHYYPIYSSYSYGYDRGYRATRRQQRLDRDYHERITHGSNYASLDSSCRTESNQWLQTNHRARTRDHYIARDCLSDTAISTGGGRLQSNAATNKSLVAVGQNVMAWDGTKMPGGEAAGLYR